MRYHCVHRISPRTMYCSLLANARAARHSATPMTSATSMDGVYSLAHSAVHRTSVARSNVEKKSKKRDLAVARAQKVVHQHHIKHRQHRRQYRSLFVNYHKHSKKISDANQKNASVGFCAVVMRVYVTSCFLPYMEGGASFHIWKVPLSQKQKQDSIAFAHRHRTFIVTCLMIFFGRLCRAVHLTLRMCSALCQFWDAVPSLGATLRQRRPLAPSSGQTSACKTPRQRS